MLSDQERKAIRAKAERSLAYVKEHGKFPRGLEVWDLFALKALMAEKEDFPYSMDMVIENGSY